MNKTIVNSIFVSTIFILPIVGLSVQAAEFEELDFSELCPTTADENQRARETLKESNFDPSPSAFWQEWAKDKPDSTVIKTYLQIGNLSKTDDFSSIEANVKTLHDVAALKNDKVLIKALLACGEIPSEAKPLKFAVLNENESMVSLLLDHGVDPDQGSALYYAAGGVFFGEDHGNLDIVKQLIDAGADVNEGPLRGWGLGPIHSAAAAGNLEILEELLYAGANVNQTGGKQRSRTALHMALIRDQFEAVRLLTHVGADLNIQDYGGLTPLFSAVADGKKKSIKFLLRHGANPYLKSRNIGDQVSESAIHLAARKGRIEVLRLFKQFDVDLNHMSDDGRAAIHRAVELGDKESVANLLQAGVSAKTSDLWQWTPAQIALYEGHRKIFKLLNKRGENITATWPETDSESSFNDHLQMLLEQEVNIHRTDMKGQTPLHVASNRGHVGLVKRLLRAGASLNRVDNEDRTALVLASANGHQDVVKELLEQGAHVKFEESDVPDPINSAVKQGQLSIVKLLVNKSSTNELAKDAQSRLLYLAAHEGHSDIVRFFLEEKANPDWTSDDQTPGGDGWTALHTASISGYSDVVRVLLKNGASIKQEEGGSTPLHFAAQKGHRPIIKQLLEAGADPHLKNKDGRDAIDLAETSSIKTLLRSNKDE